MLGDRGRRPAAGVDVAIPCYQYGHVLRECVSSVLTQELCDVRVLIIDNASTDNSVEVAQQLAAEDSRIEVVARQRNLGPHASYNEGIDWANSEYFLILGADDLLVPRALARATSIMGRRLDVHLTYGRTLWTPLSGTVPRLPYDEQEAEWRVLRGRDLLERYVRGNLYHQPIAVVRTSVQKQVGYYRPTLPHTDDYELWMRFACIGSLAETDAVQGIHRTDPRSRSAKLTTIHEWIQYTEAAFESFFAHEGASVPDSQRLYRRARRSLAEHAYWCAVSSLYRRQARSSLDLLKLAFRLSPTTTIVPPFGYLFRREDAFRRIVHHLSGMVRWPSTPAKPVSEWEG
jgi:glycosyltransferase involved in cell wall biosynthesis